MHVDHVALTVPDIDEAVRFYRDVSGATELYRMGPFDAEELPEMQDGCDWTQAHLNIAGARLNFVMMALGKNLMLELFRYERPVDTVQTLPRNCDMGASHIALKVKNLDDALTFLRGRGIQVMAGPIAIDSGPCAGLRVNYFLDPFGNQLELVEYDRLRFMDETDTPLCAHSGGENQ
ncbi:VOC family protein [Paraburkholderia sp. JHI869]|uniref:VOC family protein n=1 Tax=Paraburkholderia sp. JHI869 TaxID=3112959 RepID=UPI0031755F57